MAGGRRIAILGAGIAGVSAALELARRGCAVDLYDENTRALTRASGSNEGKLHLGLVYAHDPSLRTARTLMLGALHFGEYLKRWCGVRPDDLPISTPFYYAVQDGTMVGADALAGYYQRCQRLFAELAASTGLAYLADRSLLVQRLTRTEAADVTTSELTAAVFRTSERAVDPRAVADLLRAALAAAPRLTFFGGTTVCRVTRTADGRLDVAVRAGGETRTERYDQVANTLWHGRLEIDATIGLRPARAWIFRYKLGGWTPCPAPPAVPSLSFVLGPYGDIVNFGARGLYGRGTRRA